MGGLIAGRARQIESLMGVQVIKDLQDMNVVDDGPDNRFGAEVVPAEGATIEGFFKQGFIYNVEARGFDENLPSTTRPLTSTFSDTGDQNIAKWNLEPIFVYAQIDIPGPTEHLNKLGNKAFLNVLNTQVSSMMTVRSMEMKRYWWSSGEARLATCSDTAASGTSSVQVKRSDAASGYKYSGERGGRWCRPGRVGVWINPQTGARVGSRAYKVRSVDAQPAYGYDRLNFTMALDADITPGMLFVPGDYDGNAYRKEPNGALNIYDDGTVESNHLGVDREDFKEAGLYPELIFGVAAAEGTVAHFQKWTDGLTERVVDMYHQATGETNVTFYARREVLRELTWQDEIRESLPGGTGLPSERMTRTNQAGGRGPGNFSGGAKSFVFYHDDVQVSFAQDAEAPPNGALGKAAGYLKKYIFEPWHAEDGFGSTVNGAKAFYTDPKKDMKRWRYREMENAMSERPFAACRIDNILTQQDVTPIR